MDKQIFVAGLVAAALGATLPFVAAAASSGTSSGSATASGSFGLGIDYGALVSASTASQSLPKQDAQTLGGPINGVRAHFERQQRGTPRR